MKRLFGFFHRRRHTVTVPTPLPAVPARSKPQTPSSPKIGNLRELRRFIAKTSAGFEETPYLSRDRANFEAFKLAIAFALARPDILGDMPERPGFKEILFGRFVVDEIILLTYLAHQRGYRTYGKTEPVEDHVTMVSMLAVPPHFLSRCAVFDAPAMGGGWRWLWNRDGISSTSCAAGEGAFVTLLFSLFPNLNGNDYFHSVVLVDNEGLPRFVAALGSGWFETIHWLGGTSTFHWDIPEEYHGVVNEIGRWILPRYFAGVDLAVKPVDGTYELVGAEEGHAVIADGLFVSTSIFYQGILDTIRYVDGTPSMAPLPSDGEGATTRRWMPDGARHRQDGPAYQTFKDGGLVDEGWFLHGRLHRLDGPAWERRLPGVHCAEWYNHGRLHRLGGPAFQRTKSLRNGPTVVDMECWYEDGVEHNRDGGPTVRDMGKKEERWHAHGELHRFDGPAVKSPGLEEWHLRGRLHRDDGPAVADDFVRRWYRHGRLHRVDGPAVVIAGNREEWWLFGRRHRTDGPALIEHRGGEFHCAEWWSHGVPGVTLMENGDRQWLVAGKRHRMDAPAFIGSNGEEEWYWHGRLHRDAAPAAVSPSGERRWYFHGSLHRDDGPAVIHPNGAQEWYRVGERHRTDGPAHTAPGGFEAWYLDGVLHREDGPAISHFDGTCLWYRHGQIQGQTDRGCYALTEAAVDEWN
jgi:hypothetical protein